MTSTFRPDDARGVLEAVAWAAAEDAPLEIYGHGSRRSVGRPVQAEYGLDLSGLVGVSLYEPEELVLSVAAGTPMIAIERLLRDHNQALAFEPMDMGPLSGVARGRGTIGGVLASNGSGPRRIRSARAWPLSGRTGTAASAGSRPP